MTTPSASGPQRSCYTACTAVLFGLSGPDNVSSLYTPKGRIRTPDFYTEVNAFCSALCSDDNQAPRELGWGEKIFAAFAAKVAAAAASSKKNPPNSSRSPCTKEIAQGATEIGVRVIGGAALYAAGATVVWMAKKNPWVLASLFVSSALAD